MFDYWYEHQPLNLKVSKKSTGLESNLECQGAHETIWKGKFQRTEKRKKLTLGYFKPWKQATKHDSHRERMTLDIKVSMKLGI